MKQYLEQVQSESVLEIKKLEKDIQDHIKRYGIKDCDYLINRRQLLSYYKGRSALAYELIQNCK